MNLLEAFILDEIFIDFGADVLYGSDQCNVSFPCRFPTVTFQLMATNGLSQIADRIRKDLGFAPMHPMDEYWLDDTVGSIELDEESVTIRWRDGKTSKVKLSFISGRYSPSAYADFYNDFLDAVRSGEKKNKYKNLMGLNREG